MIIEVIFVIWELLYKMINFKTPFQANISYGMHTNIKRKINKIGNKIVSNELIELFYKFLRVNRLERPEIKDIVNK